MWWHFVPAFLGEELKKAPGFKDVSREECDVEILYQVLEAGRALSSLNPSQAGPTPQSHHQPLL